MPTSADAAFTKALDRAQAHVNLPPPPERRAIRERCGLSQEAIAVAVGTSGATVSRWETGRALPCGRVLRRYAAVLSALADLTREDITGPPSPSNKDTPPDATSGASGKTGMDGLDAEAYTRR